MNVDGIRSYVVWSCLGSILARFRFPRARAARTLEHSRPRRRHPASETAARCPSARKSRGSVRADRGGFGLSLPVMLLVAAAVLGVASGCRPPQSPAGAVHNDAHPQEDPHAHGGGHAHGAGEADELQLSSEARESIGLLTGPVSLQPYSRTIDVPGIVVERPGRTVRHVPAPLAGVVKQIYRTEGEMIRPGEPLFELHLMHEELVEAQGEFLRLFEEQQVAESEVHRLEAVASAGVVAGRKLIERQNEYKRVTAQLNAYRQRLLLHGLSDSDLERIESQRLLVHGVTVRAPPGHDPESPDGTQPAAERAAAGELQLRRLNVEVGQHVMAGESLCELVDYSDLYIEGQAFGPDMPYLQEVLRTGRTVDAEIGSGLGRQETVDNLKIAYIDNAVDPMTRLHAFYIDLPNQAIDAVGESDRFVHWRFRPGQRAKILVPVAAPTELIVLPADAVVQDGLESYVFVQNGELFQRRAVRVQRREVSRNQVAVAPGTLFPGTIIAMNSADLLNLELKNRAGGGADPHAGHSH